MCRAVARSFRVDRFFDGLSGFLMVGVYDASLVGVRIDFFVDACL